MSFIVSMVNGLLGGQPDALHRKQSTERMAAMSDYYDLKANTFDGRLKRIPAYDKRIEIWNSFMGPSCPSCR